MHYIKSSIIQYLSLSYGINAYDLESLPIGADPCALVFKAQTEAGDYFVKAIKKEVGSASQVVMNLLLSAGLGRIIPPIQTINDQSIQCVDDMVIAVYPFLKVENGFKQALTAEQWQILGRELKKLHEINVPASLQQQLRHESYSAQFRDAVRSLYASLPAMIPNDPIAQNFIESLTQHSIVIQKLVCRAEALAQSVKDASDPFVLCHEDIHGGNVLIDENNEIYIVDWDSSLMAPKERDLMFIGGGVGNVWNRQYEEELFYKGYGNVQVNRSMLAYYRHERVVEDIALFGESILFANASLDSKLENYHHFQAMFEPNGVVDIALRSDGGSGAQDVAMAEFVLPRL
ncbi:MAG: aminoglycoside phosphotransferase family protein [Alphaproteobacteria bacterium]|nr:aminoglycoside phosphotransferase family protein [Alphaproteobacteria bacterium]OJV46645.1 MAG: hypothetical protein BGO28_04775 [Alphaproteobacteria bacterium 43-37]